MSHARSVAPRHRRRTASTKPAEAEVAFPIGDFLIRPTDALGRHVIINVQVAPQVRRASSIMIAKKEFGFETEQDVMRWCLTRGLEELAKKSENREITEDIAKMSAWNALAKDELEHQYYLSAIEVQEHVVRTLVKSGRPGRAAHHAEMLWSQHDKIEDPYWRAEFRRKVKAVLDYAREAVLQQERDRKEALQVERRSQRRRARMS